MTLNGRKGRYLQYSYGLEGKGFNTEWQVQADCKDYTANWDQDGSGWFNVRNPSMYLGPKEGRRGNARKYNSTKEAKAVLDEFCPVMQQLIDKKGAAAVEEF